MIRCKGEGIAIVNRLGSGGKTKAKRGQKLRQSEGRGGGFGLVGNGMR